MGGDVKSISIRLGRFGVILGSSGGCLGHLVRFSWDLSSRFRMLFYIPRRVERRPKSLSLVLPALHDYIAPRLHNLTAGIYITDPGFVVLFYIPRRVARRPEGLGLGSGIYIPVVNDYIALCF